MARLIISSVAAFANWRPFVAAAHWRKRKEKPMKPNNSQQRGQAMTEYLIVVALVAVAAIAVYQLFGQVVRSQTAAMARELAGEDGSEQSSIAQSAADAAAGQTAARTLKSFTGNAGAGQ